jgi:integral membrane protein (TIGR01906 family)
METAMEPTGPVRERHPYLTVFLIILTALWLFSISFRVVLLPPVTAVLAESNVNDRLSSLSHAQLVEVAESGRAFVVGERDATLPEGADERVAFTPDVVSHMQDVRYVLQGVEIVTLVLTVLMLIAAVVSMRRAGRGILGAAFLGGSIFAVVLALLFVIFGVVSFDTLFAGMHSLFFAEGTWTFAEDSLLICAYPLGFWIGMAVVWALALVVCSAIVASVGVLLRRGA